MPRYLIQIEALTPNPASEACIQFIARLEVAVDERPLPIGPFRHLVAKFINDRLGVQIPSESRDFNAGQWVSQLAAQEMNAEHMSLMAKLTTAVNQYWKSFPKNTQHADWALEFKDKLKALNTKPNTSTAAEDPIAPSEGATVAADEATEGALEEGDAAAPAVAATAPPVDANAPTIAVGDVVIGRAHKFKDKFNDVEGKVVAVLAKHYNVHLLTGAAAGTQHKYLHACVSLKDPPVSDQTVVPAATGARAPMSVEDMWDEF